MNETLTKSCTKCLQEKPFSEYNRDCTKKYNLASACKICTRASQRKINQTPEGRIKRRLSHIKNRYKIDEKEYQKLLQEANWSCQICGLHEIHLQEKHPKSKGIHVDHDHETGKVRGMLCQRCNSILGQARDNIEILESAIKYLKKHQ